MGQLVKQKLISVFVLNKQKMSYQTITISERSPVLRERERLLDTTAMLCFRLPML